MRRIYHLTTRPQWEHAADAAYRVPSLDAEGFIHCANAEQVAWAANRFYADAPELLVLTVEVGRLTSPLKDEAGGPGTDLFPHVYGPINRDAVVRVEPLTRDPEGHWTFTVPHV